MKIKYAKKNIVTRKVTDLFSLTSTKTERMFSNTNYKMFNNFDKFNKNNQSRKFILNDNLINFKSRPTSEMSNILRETPSKNNSNFFKTQKSFKRKETIEGKGILKTFDSPSMKSRYSPKKKTNENFFKIYRKKSYKVGFIVNWYDKNQIPAQNFTANTINNLDFQSNIIINQLKILFDSVNQYKMQYLQGKNVKKFLFIILVDFDF